MMDDTGGARVSGIPDTDVCHLRSLRSARLYLYRALMLPRRDVMKMMLMRSMRSMVWKVSRVMCRLNID